MKDYSKMSDFEICGYASMHENGFSWIEFDDEMSSHVKCGNEGSPGFAIVEVKDYCNNPSDAWPIMLANGIATITENGEIIGATNNSQEYYENFGSRVYSEHDKEKPLLAAMIVYLMMRDAE